MIKNSTIQRVLEAADILEVVGDFVSLKRRGANWVGLCPFHNDRSPSFYVSKSKNLCKCFACGEGGSPVNFIMKHEQLTFQEAIRYLGRKYNIEVEEREMTDAERQAESKRENMFAVNDFAMRYFADYMLKNPNGRNVGLAYFQWRGISDQMIERFHLGFAPEGRDEFFKEATARGYSEENLVATGLVTRTDDGRVYDRFRGRVIYPVLSLSGKAVAFGGRTLSKEKTVAKYVNSPESEIYSKRRELYGLYQAKNAISKAGKVFLVEGYMDVISMHQAGVCNVVASSGTALTIEQVRLIKRFTQRVTLVYDSDAAGIKASMRGIELLLQEGLDIKAMLLPEGEDPDSFAQNHSASEVEEYIAANEKDFVTFMADIELAAAGDSPTERARVITHIVKTIALIPNEITRSVYIQDCSRILFIAEDVLRREVGKYFNEYALKSRQDRERAEAAMTLPPDADAERADAEAEAKGESRPTVDATATYLRQAEKGLMQLVVRYANYQFAEGVDEDGNSVPMTVLDVIDSELAADSITLSNPDLARLFDEARAVAPGGLGEDRERERARLEAVRGQRIKEGIDEIRAKATDIGSIAAMERTLHETADAEMEAALADYDVSYVSRMLCSSADDTVRTLATDLAVERHILSKMHTKYARIDTERDQLGDLVPRKIHELKDAILRHRIINAHARMKQCGADFEAQLAVMREIRELEAMRRELVKLIGDRVVTPMRMG